MLKGMGLVLNTEQNPQEIFGTAVSLSDGFEAGQSKCVFGCVEIHLDSNNFYLVKFGGHPKRAR